VIELKTPTLELLPRYVDALQRGWTPDHILGIAATQEQLAAIARAQGLPYVEITTDPDNLASQNVITANGGVLIEAFTKPAAFGNAPGLRFRIPLC